MEEIKLKIDQGIFEVQNLETDQNKSPKNSQMRYLMSLPKLEVAEQEDDEKFIHSALQKSQREIVSKINSQDIISYPQLQNISINRSQKSPTASLRSVSQQEKNLDNNYIQLETGLSSQRTLKNANGIQVGPNFSLLANQNKQFSQRKLMLPPRPPTGQGMHQGEFPLYLNNSFGNEIIQQRISRNLIGKQIFSTNKEEEALEEAEVGSDDDEFKEGGSDSYYQSCRPCTNKQSSYKVEGGSSNLNSPENQSEGENVDLDEADELNSDHTLSQLRQYQKEQELLENHYPQNIRSGGISSKKSQLSQYKSGRLTEQVLRENHFQIDDFDKFQNQMAESIMASGSITDKIEYAKITAELLRQTSFANNQVISFDDNVHDQMNRTGKFNTNTVNNLQNPQKGSLQFDINYVPQFTDEDQLSSGEKKFKKRKLLKNETAKIIDSPQSFLKLDYPDDISINRRLVDDQVPNTIFYQNHLTVPNSQIPLGPQQYQSMNSYNFSNQVPQYYDNMYSKNQSKLTSSRHSRPEIYSEKSPYQNDEVKKYIQQLYNFQQNKSIQDDLRSKLISEKKASTIYLQQIQQILKECIAYFSKNLDQKVVQICGDLQGLQKDNIQTEKYVEEFTNQVTGMVASFQQDINSLNKWKNAYQVKENKWAEEIMDLQDKCQQRQFQIDHLKREFAEQILSLQKLPVSRRQSLVMEKPSLENNSNEQHSELTNMIQNFFEILNEQKTLKSLQKQKNRGSSQGHIYQPNLNEIINDNLLGGLRRRRSDDTQLTPQSVVFNQQNLNSKYEEIFTEIRILFQETFSENNNLKNSIEALVAISIRSYFELGYFLDQEIVDDADLQGQYIKEIKQQIKQKVYDKLQELKRIQIGMSMMAIDVDYGKDTGKPPFKKKRHYQNLQISSEISSKLLKSNSLNLEPLNVGLRAEVNSPLNLDHKYQMKNYGTNTITKTDESSYLSLQDKFNIGESYIVKFSEIIDDARNNLVTQLAQLQKQLSHSRQLLFKLHSQTENDKKIQINLQDEVLKLTTQLTSEASEHIQTKKRCDKLQRSSDNHQQQFDGLMNQIEKSDELLLQKDRQINKIQEELKWQQIEVSKNQMLNFDFQTEIHRKKMLIENLQKEVSEKQTKADEYLQSIKMQEMEIKQLHDQIDNNFSEVVLRDITLWLEETLTYNTHFLIQQEIVNQLVLHFEDQSPDKPAQGIVSKLVKHSNEFEPVRQRLKGNVKGIKVKIKEYRDMISQQNIQYKKKKQNSHSFMPDSPSRLSKESSYKSRRQTGSKSQEPNLGVIIDAQIFYDKDDQLTPMPFPQSPKEYLQLDSSRSQKSYKLQKKQVAENMDNFQQSNQDLSLRLELVMDEKNNLQKRLKSLQTRLLKLEDLRQKEEINQANLKALKQRYVLVIDKLKQIILDSKETRSNVSFLEDLLKKLDQLPSVGSLTFNYLVSQATQSQPNYDYLNLSKRKSDQYQNNRNYENNDSEEDNFRSFKQLRNSSTQKPRQSSMHLNTSLKNIQNSLNKDLTISEINQDDSQISLRLEYEVKSSERLTAQQIQIVDHKEDKNLQLLNQSSIMDESQSMMSVKHLPNELQHMYSQIGDKRQSDFGARHVSFGQNINGSNPSKLMDEIFRSRSFFAKGTQTEQFMADFMTQTEQINDVNINLEDIYIFTSNQRDLHLKVNQIYEKQWVQVHIQEDGLQLATETSQSTVTQQKDEQIDIYIQDDQQNYNNQQNMNNSQPHPSPASDIQNKFKEVNDKKQSFKFYDSYVPDEQKQKEIQADDLMRRQSNLYDLDFEKLNKELMARTPMDEVAEAGLGQTQAVRGQFIGDMLIIEDSRDSRDYEEDNQQYTNFRPSGSEGIPDINEHFFQPENERQYGVQQQYQNEQLDLGLEDDEDEGVNNKYVFNYFNSAVPETIQEEQDGEGESQNLNEDLNYSKVKGKEQTNSSENLQKSALSIQEVNIHLRQLSEAIQQAELINESSSKQSFHSVADSQINSQNQDNYSESQRSQQSKTKSSKSKYLTRNLNQ